MKKFYIFFCAGFILLSTLLYISIWWFMAGAAIIIILTVYYFYSARLKAMDASIADLEIQVDELQVQLDQSILKEAKATKEAGQIRQTKQQLLTVVSHEIRTPMNGVLGMSLLLADTSLTTEQKDYVNTIKKSGESLLETVNEILVNDVIDYSKLDRKNKTLDIIDFDLRDCIEEVLNMFAVKAEKTNLDLLYSIDDNVPLQLMGDSKRLREILMNLVENGVKFTQEGEILIKVQLNKNNSGPNIQLMFEVHDSGAGMTARQVKQLFYDSGGREFNNEEEQQGRGLIVCRKLTEMMGGTIDVKSKQGEGSIFNFSLPFNKSLNIDRKTVSDKITLFENKHVLIIDDNLTSRGILIKQLAQWNMIPVGAMTGSQALEILSQNNKFDLILTDTLTLPVDSIQLTKIIKSKYPDIPVILLNPFGNKSCNEPQNLFAAMIKKPVRIHSLQDEIFSVLKNAGADQKIHAAKMEMNFSEKYPLHILIAEDNLINQKIAIKILSRLGYQPKVASNGREALEMAQQEAYDIILMDVQMPVMDGLEATRMIRSNLTTQPIIMAMTANVMQGDRDLCMQAGMDDYISKPIDLNELLSHLEKWSVINSGKEK